MTWSRSVTSPESETIGESLEKVDISDLKPQYQEQFRAAAQLAERMLGVDEAPEGNISINMSGYASPMYGPDSKPNGAEIRSIYVQLYAVPVYVEDPAGS